MAELPEIVERLCGFLGEQVLAEGVEARPDTVLSEIGIDSFSLMEILLFLERSYGPPFPLEQLTPENIQTVETLGRCYAALLAEQG